MSEQRTPTQKLISGTVWLYGSQLSTVLFQLGYAAITSRLLGPTHFGEYAVALSASGLVALLASSGFIEAVSWTQDLENRKLRALVTLSLINGLAGSAALFLLAPLWANFWANEQSETVCYYLIFSVLITPILTISTSIVRRQGNFKGLAAATLISNVLGMILGIAGVLVFKSSGSLTLSLTFSQVCLLTITLVIGRQARLGFVSPKRALAELHYSFRFSLVKIFEYVNSNSIKWGVSYFLGSAVVGVWNRAEVLTTVPFWQLQNALLQAVEPEFRHTGRDSTETRRAWSDMLISLNWLFLPLAAVIGAVLPLVSPLLIGAKWGIDGSVFTPLAFIGAFSISVFVLNSALQSSGDLRNIWISNSLVLANQMLGVFFLSQGWGLSFILYWILGSICLQHTIQVWQSFKAGKLDPFRILRSYLLAASYSATLSFALNAFFSNTWSEQSNIPTLVSASLMFVGLFVVSAFNWRKAPFLLAIREYKLFAKIDV
jgi:O-antigen/teichoic acid export membrane protein